MFAYITKGVANYKQNNTTTAVRHACNCIVQIKPRNINLPHARKKDCSDYQLTPFSSEILTFECCKKHLTFEGLFKSNTFVCALIFTTL